MKLWIDDVRPAPAGYMWCRSVNQAIEQIVRTETVASVNEDYKFNEIALKHDYYRIELIDIDHDAGIYAPYGGDYIKILDWLEETGRNYPIHIHSMNPVGVENMRQIIRRNNWREV